MSKPRGGARPGSGRKLGATTHRTRQAAESILQDGGITALEVLAKTMRALWKEATNDGEEVVNISAAKEAAAIAEKAAPYMHPRLAAVEHSGAVETHHVARLPQVMRSVTEWQQQYAPQTSH